MTEKRRQAGDMTMICALSAIWLLLWPDAGAWLRGGPPLEAELAGPGAALGDLRAFSPLMRSAAALILAILITAGAALATRLFASRFGGFLFAVLMLTHPVTLAARLDPAIGLHESLLLSLALAALHLATGRRALRLIAWIVALAAGGTLVILANRPSLGIDTDALLMIVAPSGRVLPEGFEPLKRSFFYATPLAILLICSLRSRDKTSLSTPLLGLGALGLILTQTPSVAPGPLTTHLATLLAPVFTLSLLASGAARSAMRDLPGRALLGAALLVLILSGLGTARRVEERQTQARTRVSRFVEAVRTLPRQDDRAVELILGLTESQDPALGPHAGLLFPKLDVRVAKSLPSPGPGHALRVLEWRPVTPLTTGDPSSYSLEAHVMAQQATPDELHLRAPAADTSVPCQKADDEPVFSWTVSASRDPGPSAFTFVAVRVARDGNDGGPVLTRLLDETVLERTVEGDRVVWSWRPSVRSEKHAERELLWEYEDVAPRGSTFTWTIVVHRNVGPVLFAAPWALSVQY